MRFYASCQVYFYDRVLSTIYVRARKLRSADTRTLAVNRTCSSFGDRTFAAAATRVWKSLPPDMRKCNGICICRLISIRYDLYSDLIQTATSLCIHIRRGLYANTKAWPIAWLPIYYTAILLHPLSVS